MAQQLTSADWKQCQQICLALLHTGPSSVSAVDVSSPPLQAYAAGCAVLCLRYGDPEWFRLGAAALSLHLQIESDWRLLAATAAALRFALDQTGLDRLAILAETPQLEEPVRRLLSFGLSASCGDLAVQLTPCGLDLASPAGDLLGDMLPRT